MAGGEIQISPVGGKKSPRIKLFSSNNRAVISDLTAKYVAEHHQNEILRQLLIDNGIEIPEEVKLLQQENEKGNLNSLTSSDFFPSHCLMFTTNPRPNVLLLLL